MDAARREKKEHGTLSFPFQIYPALDGSEADDSDFIPYHWHPELEIITVDCGITALDEADYARELGVSDETLLRALTLSNLTTIHEKTPIGRLSAYCGAISAGAGAGAGIAYLCGGDYDAVIHTVVNALAVVSGVICDGAKASCAAKIATAVEAGLLGYNMYIRGNQFRAGDGIVAKGVENSLKNVGRLGKQGMKETNNEIIAIMVGC